MTKFFPAVRSALKDSNTLLNPANISVTLFLLYSLLGAGGVSLLEMLPLTEKSVPFWTSFFQYLSIQAMSALGAITACAWMRMADGTGKKVRLFFSGALLFIGLCALTILLAGIGCFSGGALPAEGEGLIRLNYMVGILLTAHFLRFLAQWGMNYWNGAIALLAFDTYAEFDAIVFLFAFMYDGRDVLLSIHSPVISFFQKVLSDYVILAVVGVILLRHVIGLCKEIKEVNAVLAGENSQLILFWEGNPVRTNKPSDHGDFGENRSGRCFTYNATQVYSQYVYYYYRTLRPSADCDCRLFLNGDGISDQQLQGLADSGWIIYVVGELKEFHAAKFSKYSNVIVMPFAGTLLDSDEKNDWIRDQIRMDREGIQSSMGLVSAMEVGDEDPCLTFLRHVQRTILYQSDEVEAFYQLLKAATYIIHCRALIACTVDENGESNAVNEKKNPKSFPHAPSFGTLDELQRGWGRNKEIPDLWEDVRTLESSGSGNFQKGKNYSRICGVLANLHNCYVGHGTLAYRVTPGLVHALTNVVVWMIEDFAEQGRYPSPDDRVRIIPKEGKAAQESLPACMIRDERFYLLSALVGNDGEYLCYETGALLTRDDKPQIYELDQRWEGGAQS